MGFMWDSDCNNVLYNKKLRSSNVHYRLGVIDGYDRPAEVDVIRLVGVVMLRLRNIRWRAADL